MRKLLPIILLLSISAYAETITLTPSDDASIRDGINAVNENASTLHVFDSNSIARHTFIKFDIDDHTDDVTGDDITSATLRVYIHSVPRAGEITFAIPNVDWDEDSLTGNNYPATFSNSSYATADIAKNDKGDYLEIDITDVAQDWFDDGDNYGIAILPISGDKVRVKFSSQKVSSKRPEVVMETSDAVAIAYEPWNVSNSFDTKTLSDGSYYLLSFFPPAKVNYSKAKLFIEKGSTDSFTGTIGVAIYDSDSYGPWERLGSGTVDFINEDVDNKFIEIEFDDPISLSVGTRYWFAIGMDSDDTLKIPRANNDNVNLGQAKRDVIFSSSGGFENQYVFFPGLQSSQYMWFRLEP